MRGSPWVYQYQITPHFSHPALKTLDKVFSACKVYLPTFQLWCYIQLIAASWKFYITERKASVCIMQMWCIGRGFQENILLPVSVFWLVSFLNHSLSFSLSFLLMTVTFQQSWTPCASKPVDMNIPVPKEVSSKTSFLCLYICNLRSGFSCSEFHVHFFS